MQTIERLKIYHSPHLRARMAVNAIESALVAFEDAYSCNPMAGEFYLADLEHAASEIARLYDRIKQRCPNLSNPVKGT